MAKVLVVDQLNNHTHNKYSWSSLYWKVENTAPNKCKPNIRWPEGEKAPWWSFETGLRLLCWDAHLWLVGASLNPFASLWWRVKEMRSKGGHAQHATLFFSHLNRPATPQLHHQRELQSVWLTDRGIPFFIDTEQSKWDFTWWANR